MAEYNSAYTGQQIDVAVGAVIEKQEAWDNKVSTVTITIPKGRAKGDVDGDGKWTESDESLMMSISVGNVTPTDIERWCGDVNGDGAVTSADAREVQKMAKGIYNYPSLITDYYGNWIFDAISGSWSADISLPGVDVNTNLILNVFDPDAYANIIKAEITGTGIKVYMRMPPLSDVLCMGESGAGNGKSIIVSDVSDIFYATYGVTTIAELDSAYAAGRFMVCVNDGNTAPIARVSSAGYYYFGLTLTGKRYICSKSGAWSEKLASGGLLPTVTTSDNGKFLRVVDGAWAANEALPSDIGAAAESLSHQVTLTASGWNSTTKTQTVTCADILADVTKQEIHAMPVDTSAGNAYYSAGIMPVAQAANSLTFYAETIPTADIGVYVAIHPLKFS
uniref:Dockerin type 1 n=1 Tax=Myoviridae sp. ctagO6 TaxID=2826667 RepID=A0A8S5NQH0_9CAUD|nr:MAG TPA: dockerin type 1 [Myoviridae sp. ctagO6]